MTQKQFEAIKAQINKTNRLIERATEEVKTSIERRKQAVVSKMPNFIKQLSDTATQCEYCSFNIKYTFKNKKYTLKNYANYCRNEKTKVEEDLLRISSENESCVYLDVYYNKENFEIDVEKMFDLFDKDYLELAEDLLTRLQEFQALIREKAIQLMQEHCNWAMERLTDLQKV